MARTRSSSSSPTSSRRSSRTRFDAAASPISGRRHPRSRSELCAVVGWARVGEGERAVAGRARRNEGARPQDRGRLESRAWGGTRCCSCSSRNVRYRRPSSSSSSAAARRHLEGAERPSQVEQLDGAGSSVQRLLSFEFSPRRKSLLFLGAGRKSLAQLGVTSPSRSPQRLRQPLFRSSCSLAHTPTRRPIATTSLSRLFKRTSSTSSKMVTASLNGTVLAESANTQVVEGNHVRPACSCASLVELS